MPSVKVNINGPSFMKWMIVPYAANYFKINEDDNIQLTATLQYESHFILNNDNNIPIEYTEKHAITKQDLIQYEDFMKHASAFFMNDEVAEEDKEKLFRDISELFWKAKEINKEKYGRKKKK